MIEYTRFQQLARAQKAIENSGVALIAYGKQSDAEQTNRMELSLARLYEEQREQEDDMDDE